MSDKKDKKKGKSRTTSRRRSRDKKKRRRSRPDSRSGKKKHTKRGRTPSPRRDSRTHPSSDRRHGDRDRNRDPYRRSGDRADRAGPSGVGGGGGGGGGSPPKQMPPEYGPVSCANWIRWHEMTTKDDLRKQKEFDESNIESGSYLREKGFPYKKVMYAYRKLDTKDYEWGVSVTIDECHYVSGDRNWVKVGGVVFPELAKGPYERIYENIVKSKIPGCYLYWIIYTINKSARMSVKSPGERLSGSLRMIRFGRTQYPLSPYVYKGVINGIYPYYSKDREYVPYLEFNANNTDPGIYQQRFSNSERERGIHELNPQQGIQCLRDYSEQNELLLSAIYVPKYVTLTVNFTNKSFDKTKNRHRKLTKDYYHERLVIQGGGCVSLVGYPLSYQFMNDIDFTKFRFSDKESYAENQSVITQPKFQDMSALMARVDHPLIVLGESTSYAGYLLEIKNRGTSNKRAILQIPMGGSFSDVHELGPNIHQEFANEANPPMKGTDFLTPLWNPQPTQPPEPYREFTGPYNGLIPIDWTKREAFPDSDAGHPIQLPQHE